MSLGDKRIQPEFSCLTLSPELPTRASPKCRFIRFWRGREPWRQGISWGSGSTGRAVGIGRAGGNGGGRGSRAALRGRAEGLRHGRRRAVRRRRRPGCSWWTGRQGRRRSCTCAASTPSVAGPHLRSPPAQRPLRHRTPPAAAGGHYNADAHAGHTPVVVSERTEVWLDFTVDAEGVGDSSTAVAFPVTPAHDRSSSTRPPPTPPRASRGLAWPASGGVVRGARSVIFVRS